ncbi:KEOPS complex subunit Pcc1 [Halovivax gelatinilyticus]|uniref:KEOPS complex subunit Pcc1 n=1 Tax=Halovivax gelatinilyticus TaxID=2961597 RepID=UPI0020CA36BF|nr:KEOPS complex subunit Pcc1 [Halovivax gelatinilyticus]
MTPRAEIRTRHADPETVAASIAPDNTDEMETRVETAPTDDDRSDRVVLTTIERDSTNGLQSTVDDTIVNLEVADQIVNAARTEPSPSARSADANHQTTDNTNDKT